MRIHLRNHNTRIFSSTLDNIHRNAQTTQAIFIRGRSLNHRYIQRHLTRLEQAGNIGKADRRVIAKTLLDDFPDILGNEETVYRETVGEFLGGVGGITASQQLDDFDIGEFAGTSHKGFNKFHRRCTARAQKYALARLYMGNRFVGSNHHFRVVILPVGIVTYLFFRHNLLYS